jgi:hypothetical protein
LEAKLAGTTRRAVRRKRRNFVAVKTATYKHCSALKLAALNRTAVKDGQLFWRVRVLTTRRLKVVEKLRGEEFEGCPRTPIRVPRD